MTKWEKYIQGVECILDLNEEGYKRQQAQMRYLLSILKAELRHPGLLCNFEALNSIADVCKSHCENPIEEWRRRCSTEGEPDKQEDEFMDCLKGRKNWRFKKDED